MSRSRVSTARNLSAIDRRVVASAGGSATPATGAMASAAWLRSLGARAPTLTRWHVEVALDIVNNRAPSEFDELTATRFHLDIYSEEWGFYFCHDGHSSWIRVTDIAFVHGRDDFKLLDRTPALRDIGLLIRELEASYGIQFHRAHASVRTNLPGLEIVIRAWIATL